jgi:hypothetical protein
MESFFQFTLIDQSASKQVFKLVQRRMRGLSISWQNSGPFKMEIEGYNKEDGPIQIHFHSQAVDVKHMLVCRFARTLFYSSSQPGIYVDRKRMVKL